MMHRAMEQPDTITIEVSEDEEIFANSVDLFVTIKGKSLYTGKEAYKKAREVRELVEGLENLGLPQSDILLQGVSADVSSGVIGKQSSATYRLRIKCQRLDSLADILGVITSQQNSTLGHMHWNYDEEEAYQAQLLEKCLSKSKQKAERVAASLGVDLLGVHELNERPMGSEPQYLRETMPSFAAGSTRGKNVTKETLGLSVSHSKKINLNLTIKYRVGSFSTTE